jgi:hypothetical protein
VWTPGPVDWQGIAEGLWALLDDIDTLGDSIKPQATAYFRAVERIHKKRHGFMTSDGYTLTPAERHPPERTAAEVLAEFRAHIQREHRDCPRSEGYVDELAALLEGKGTD